MKKRLKDHKLIVVISAVLLSVGVGSAIRLLTDPPNAASNASDPAFASAVEGGMQPLSVSLAAVASNFQSSDLRLLQSTPTQSRLPEISAGRADPFSSLTQPPTGSIPSAQPPATGSLPVGAVQSISNQPGGGLPLVPVAATQSLPPLPSLPPVSLGPTVSHSPHPFSNASPAAALPPIPALINTIDAIQVSGVLHVGDRISVIVRESDQNTSRYVGVGAYLANGRVRVKRIDMNSGEEPIVVLEQDGQEYFKRIGDTTLTSS